MQQLAGLITEAKAEVYSYEATPEKQALYDKIATELEKLIKLIKGKEKYIEDLDVKDSPEEKEEREKIEALKKQRDEKFGTKIGNMAKHAGHSLHEAYTYPIRKMLQFIAWTAEMFGKKTKLQDEKYREKLANIIYATAMFSVAGYGVASHIKHLVGVGPVLTTLADGVKAGKSIADIVKDAALLI
jgi:hypothetical protein